MSPLPDPDAADPDAPDPEAADPDAPDPDEVDEPARGWSRGQWTAIAVAMAFLVGCAGYLVGVQTNRPPTNAVDIGFLQDMTDHHDQAVAMAQIALARGKDPTVREFAKEVLLFQRRELGLFQAYQDERGIQPADYDPERQTMAWMDMPRPLRTMTGMASQDQLDALEAASGTALDRQFLDLMITHHAGGAHMGEYAADHAADPKIRALAARMAQNQRVEAKEYQGLLDRLPAA